MDDFPHIRDNSMEKPESICFKTIVSIKKTHSRKFRKPIYIHKCEDEKYTLYLVCTMNVTTNLGSAVPTITYPRAAGYYITYIMNVTTNRISSTHNNISKDGR